MRKWTTAFLILILLLSACRSGPGLADEIDADLTTILTNDKTMVSSNPNDYIKQNRDAYQHILDKGQDALVYLTAELNRSEHNGLKEWIMAKACADLLGDESPVKEWSTGKEWIAQFERAAHH